MRLIRKHKHFGTTVFMPAQTQSCKIIILDEFLANGTKDIVLDTQGFVIYIFIYIVKKGTKMLFLKI